MSKIPDKILIKAAQNGDSEAFNVLYERHKSKIEGALITMRLVAGATMDDVLQETFISAWDKIGSFAYKSTFSVWLYSIARNKALTARQKSAKAPVSLNTGKARTRARRLPDPSEFTREASRVETAEIVQAAIKSLRPLLREVVRMHHLQGHKYIEISKALKVPIGTIKGRLNRARTILEQKLRKLGINYGIR